MLVFALSGVLLTALSYFFTGWLLRWAKNTRVLDIPNERSLHSGAVPRGGGLVIAGMTLLGTTGYAFAFSEYPRGPLACYLFTALILSVVGIGDDFKNLPSGIRFFVQVVLGIIVVQGIGFFRLMELPGTGMTDLGKGGYVLTLFWILGMTNVYNFMDGIDGIAGSHGFLSALGWIFLGYCVDFTPALLLGLFIAASTLGFLFHNWEPARLFMGDVGSTFLGFSWAVLPLLAASHAEPGAEGRFLFFSALLAWPFIFDGGFTFFRRLFRGENVFRAHRSHLYQRLVLTGFRHRTVCLIYIGLTLAGLGFGFMAAFKRPVPVAWITLAISVLGVGLWGFTAGRERRTTRNRP